MEKQDKEALRLKIIKQQREAYEIAKFLKSTMDMPIVSYVVSTRIIITKDKIQPLTEVKQLPELRIGHSMSNTDQELMKIIEIDNVED